MAAEGPAQGGGSDSFTRSFIHSTNVLRRARHVPTLFGARETEEKPASQIPSYRKTDVPGSRAGRPISR